MGRAGTRASPNPGIPMNPISVYGNCPLYLRGNTYYTFVPNGEPQCPYQTQVESR